MTLALANADWFWILVLFAILGGAGWRLFGAPSRTATIGTVIGLALPLLIGFTVFGSPFSG